MTTTGTREHPTGADPDLHSDRESPADEKRPHRDTVLLAELEELLARRRRGEPDEVPAEG